MEDRGIKPGDTVVRMAPCASAAVEEFGAYEVERFEPKTTDGLYLVGVPGRWNPQNFEVIDRP